jgi:MFS family permease
MTQTTRTGRGRLRLGPDYWRMWWQVSLTVGEAFLGPPVGSLLFAAAAATRWLRMLPALIIAGAGDAAVFAGLGLAPSAGLAAVMLAGQGFAVTWWNVVTVSLRQQIVPARLLGRVNSVYRMVGWGLMPLGALVGGLVAHQAGLRAPYLAAGILCGASLLAAVPLLLAARPEGQPGLRNGSRTGRRRRRPG